MTLEHAQRFRPTGPGRWAVR